MRKVVRQLLFSLFGLLFMLCGYAQDTETSPTGTFFKIKGFGTLGLARSDTNSAEYVRDLSQPRGLTKNWSSDLDSVVGLQANLRLAEHTEGIVQLISRYRSNGSYDPEISWAFLRHAFSPDFEVRAGRLGTEFYMLSDSRLIGYSNTPARPSVEFYGPLVFSYFDGIDATASKDVGNGILRLKFYAGHSPEETSGHDPVTWNLDGTRLLGGNVDYFVGPWQFRIAHAEAKFSSHEFPLNYIANLAIATNPALAPLTTIMPVDISTLLPELSTVGKTSRFDSIGVVYDKGPLQIQGMFGRIAHESEAYEDSRAAFILGSYRAGQFTPYLGHSRVKSSASNVTTVPPGPFGSSINQLGKTLVAGAHMDQHTTTVGVRWDFHRNRDLKLQLDSVRGKPDSIFLFRGPAVQWDGHMNVLSATLDFVF